MNVNELPSATIEDIAARRSSYAHAFGVSFPDAVQAGYSLPPGAKINTISDSRVGQQEARRMGELISLVKNSTDSTPQVLNLFDGIGSTSYAVATALPTAHVVGVDIDEETHERAKHNIARAGLQQRVKLVQADALSVLEEADGHDAIFLDPLWGKRPGGYLEGTFSISETQPPLDEIISQALEHAPVVTARAPLITVQQELATLNTKLGTELFIDTNRIVEPHGQQTIVAFFARTGEKGVSSRESMLQSGKTAWETTAYQKH
jgi:hypothetical protein